MAPRGRIWCVLRWRRGNCANRAALHGCTWTTHAILDRNPLALPAADAMYCPSTRAGTVVLDRSSAPAVGAQGHAKRRSVTVEFLTFCGYRQEAIYRHVDTFLPDAYQFASQVTMIARGPAGYVFC